MSDQSVATGPDSAIPTGSVAGATVARDESLLDAKTTKVSEVQGQRKKTESREDRLSKEMEKAAVDFAQQHHPAMASLVKRLRNRDSDAYGKAVRELSGHAVRLTRVQERQPQRFQAELNLWKIDSEIRLQLARWAVSGSDRIETTLRRLLSKRQGFKRQRLEIERDRLQARMDLIDEQLKLRGPQLKEDVDREWTKLTRKLRSANEKTPPRKKITKDNSKSATERMDAEKPNSKRPKATDAKSSKGKSAKSDKPQDIDQTPVTQRQ